ncbi:Retinoic acid induced 16-like protein-domain-containing protein [Dichotomocladium elegans]|nr:Retinoic acid induced 16-like protein-domain-containing protein [Dichotomocladium elegans]
MVDMLVDEEARQEEEDVTGVCMEHFLKHNILHYLTSMAEKADYPVGIRGETIRFVSTMINLLDDHFLTQSSIHRPTVRLVRFSALNDALGGDLYTDDLVDLMYTICSKIHGYPALLHIFFYQKDSRSGRTEPEFLLFTYLLKFVHHEGRSGDYARTGLLFIIEMASPEAHPALAEFILTASDFAINMATGLGGLYSQLPRKLAVVNEVPSDDHGGGGGGNGFAEDMLVFFQSPVAAAQSNGNAEMSTSPAFRNQLDAFLKLLEFCQEVLVRCPHADICKTLIHHIRSVFMQNILYPSILECTDEDGSSVAVISYIDMILEAVHQDALADMVVSFLINEDDDSGHCSPASSVIGGNDNSNNNVFVGLELDRIHSSSYFTAAGRFTLKNLISSRLESSSQSAVVAALKLLRTLVTKHCNYALKLFSILPDTSPTYPSVSQHQKELELYLDLISAIGKTRGHLYYGYETYLLDAEAMLENDGCFADMQGNHCHQKNSNSSSSNSHGSNITATIPFGMDDDSYSVTSFGSESTHGNGSTTSACGGGCNHTSKSPRVRRRRSFKKYAQRQTEEEGEDEIPHQNLAFSYYDSHRPTMFKHRMQQTDRLLQILLELLSNFFAQSPELNLALTGVISALTMCPYRSLGGWIGFQDTDRANPKDVLILGKSECSRSADTFEDPIYYTPSNDTTATDDDNDDDNDDLSVDYRAGKPSTTKTDPITFKSFPPFFTLLRILTQQIDYYQSDIDDFDELLAERRRLLLRHPSIDHYQQQKQKQQPAPASLPSTPFGGLFSSWLSFSSSSSYTASPNELETQAANGYSWSSQSDEIPPLGETTTAAARNSVLAHARYTQAIPIVPPFRSNFPSETNHASTDITLSMLLSNAVILEEFIKELVAIMQVRANLGIDRVHYV